MRRQLALQAAAVAAMVSLAFLIPLALLVRELAADRALTRAERDAESVARFVAVLAPDRGIEGALVALEADRLGASNVSIITADGQVLGAPVPAGEDLSGAQSGVAYRAAVDGGQAVYVPLVQADGTTAVIREFVPASELTEGVARSWLMLAGVGAVLAVLAVLLFDRLGRSVVRAVDDLEQTTERITAGDIDARVEPGGPSEMVAVGEGLNRLADRIGGMLQDEREQAANLSHRLRTPLAAARLTADAVSEPAVREQLYADLDELNRTVDHVISEARRTQRQDTSASVDIVDLARRRVEFWQALAEDEGRALDFTSPDRPLMVRIPEADAEAAIDALLGNAMSHTSPDAAVMVSVLKDGAGDAMVAIEDGGPGFPDAGVAERGRSHGDSTGLGLDIVTSTAQTAGGSISLGSSRRLGGAMVVMRLPLAGPTPDLRPARRGRFNR